MLFGIAIVLMFSFSCQIFGVLFQAKKIMNFEKVTGSYKMADVYLKEGKSSYMYLDLSKDFFVGFNTATGKTEIIPVKSIDKLEVWSADPKATKPKLPENYAGSLDAMNVIRIIKDYYRHSLETPDASSFIALLSQENYKKRNYISPAIIQQYWNKNEVGQTGIKKSEFYGYELSEPIPVKTTFEIYAIEYWKSEVIYIKYTLIKEEGTWKVDKNERKKPFMFML
jgi:hypothetical protein